MIASLCAVSWVCQGLSLTQPLPEAIAPGFGSKYVQQEADHRPIRRAASDSAANSCHANDELSCCLESDLKGSTHSQWTLVVRSPENNVLLSDSNLVIVTTMH